MKSTLITIGAVIVIIGIIASTVFADDTGFKSPTATGSTVNQWTNPSNAYTSNNSDTWATASTQKQDYSSFGFSIPAGATIDGIEVSMEGGNVAGCPVCSVGVDLSWNGTTNYSAQKDISWNNGADTIKTYGGASDTWGRSWAVSEFSDANFFLRAEATDAVYGAPDVDHIKVKVYYTESAGGVDTSGLMEMGSGTIQTGTGIINITN